MNINLGTQQPLISFENFFETETNENSSVRIGSFMQSKDTSILTDLEKKIILYLQESLEIQQLHLNKNNARKFLNTIKLIENTFDKENRTNKKTDYKFKRSSYELRTWILALCSPLMETREAYTKTLDTNQIADPEYLRNPSSWVAERTALHLHIVGTQFIQARSLSNRLNNNPPAVWAIRGNTGVGKTYSVSHDPLFHQTLEQNGIAGGTINPDIFKAFLKRSTKVAKRLFAINNQVHFEGLELCHRYMHALTTQEIKMSLLIDYTPTSPQQLTSNVLTPIRLRDGKALILDIDAPLLTSINHVFLREAFGVDPCVILFAIKDGFVEARKMRREVIEIIKNDKQVDYYKLYAFDSAGKRHTVAEKSNDTFRVYSEELLKESCTVPSSKDIEDQLKQVITEEYVDQAIAKGDIPREKRHVLDRWIGHTIEKAIELHIFNISDQQSLSDFCHNALLNKIDTIPNTQLWNIDHLSEEFHWMNDTSVDFVIGKGFTSHNSNLIPGASYVVFENGETAEIAFDSEDFVIGKDFINLNYNDIPKTSYVVFGNGR